MLYYKPALHASKNFSSLLSAWTLIKMESIMYTFRFRGKPACMRVRLYGDHMFLFLFLYHTKLCLFEI